jgi:hypothetical protein
VDAADPPIALAVDDDQRPGAGQCPAQTADRSSAADVDDHV